MRPWGRRGRLLRLGGGIGWRGSRGPSCLQPDDVPAARKRYVPTRDVPRYLLRYLPLWLSSWVEWPIVGNLKKPLKLHPAKPIKAARREAQNRQPVSRYSIALARLDN